MIQLKPLAEESCYGAAIQHAEVVVVATTVKNAQKKVEHHANEVKSLLPITHFGNSVPGAVERRVYAWNLGMQVCWSIPYARGTAGFSISLSRADARRLAIALLKFAEAQEELEELKD